MNLKMTKYMLGKMLGIEALVLMIPMVVSLIYGEAGWKYFGITSLILLAVYLLFGFRKPNNTQIYGKDGFVIIACLWILWSIFGALPFWLSGAIPSYIDALFETISGFTTTGSTILTDIEALPKGMNFWRCFTHWIGGMGVLVFMLAIIPNLSGRSIHIMRAEVPGPVKGKLVPKMRDTAKILYMIYMLLKFSWES